MGGLLEVEKVEGASFEKREMEELKEGPAARACLRSSAMAIVQAPSATLDPRLEE